MRTLVLPEAIEHLSLTTLRDKLVKIGAKVVRHCRYVTLPTGRGSSIERSIPENPEPD